MTDDIIKNYGYRIKENTNFLKSNKVLLHHYM